MKKLMNVVAVLLIVVGMLFIFQKPIENFFIQRLTDEALNSISVETVEASEQMEGEFDFSAVEDLTTEDVFNTHRNKEDLNAIGTIAIPELEMEVPIFYGLSEYNLTAGSGTMKPDQKMGEGNYSLAGHNWRDDTTLFSALHRAEEGMKVYVTDMDTVYEYTITEVAMVDPHRIDVIEDQENPMVTLITCNIDGTERLIVQGELTDTYDYVS